MGSFNVSAPAGATAGDVYSTARAPLAGQGALAALDGLTRSLSAKKSASPHALVVVGAGFGGRPWADSALRVLREMDAVIYRHIGNTTPASVVTLWRAMKNDHIDVVIGFGGGTVMDAAKAAAALAGIDE